MSLLLIFSDIYEVSDIYNKCRDTSVTKSLETFSNVTIVFFCDIYKILLYCIIDTFKYH